MKKALFFLIIAVFTACSHPNYWTPERKTQFRDTLINGLKAKNNAAINKLDLNKVCSCMIDKYVELFPDGINREIGIDTQIMIVNGCLHR